MEVTMRIWLLAALIFVAAAAPAAPAQAPAARAEITPSTVPMSLLADDDSLNLLGVNSGAAGAHPSTSLGVLAQLGFQVRKPGAGFFLYMPAPKSATGPSGTVAFESGEAFSQWMKIGRAHV